MICILDNERMQHIARKLTASDGLGLIGTWFDRFAFG
jgi:hypothetical protein